MTYGAITIVVGVLFFLGIHRFGWRRIAFSPFTIRPSRMTVARLGLAVHRREDVDRVNGILARFASGFNAMLTARSESQWRATGEATEPLERPFVEEGIAMGYALRNLFHYRPEEFESRLVKRLPQFRYLYYVGLGFWSGMRNHSPSKVESIAQGLDPLYRYLCFDGYGFKYAFFDRPRNPERIRVLDGLTGYARNAAYQGVGRALYFRFLAAPDRLVQAMRSLGEYAADAAAGVGLAAAFVNPDRLERAQALGEDLPPEWRGHFHLGMCFGLKARIVNDLDFFNEVVGGLAPRVQGAVFASIRECDRVELLVRADGDPDGYRRWRERVTGWLAENIEFPMAGVKSSARPSYTPAKVS
jgi:hypothetical protein